MQRLKKAEEIEKHKLQLLYAFDYGVNLKSRVVQLIPQTSEIEESEDWGPSIKEHDFAHLDAVLTELESYNRSAITIRIMSWGGSVQSAMAIIGRMRASKCKIITEGFGTIQSAATLILAAGQERRISEFCTFMHHSSNYGISPGTRHTQAQAFVEQAQREEEQWAKWMAEFSDKPKKFYMEQGKHLDVYWTPEQLLEFGIVDKII